MATLTLSIASASWVMTYIAVILIAHEFPFMQPHIGDARLLVPVASLAATISMARSPASAVCGWLMFFFLSCQHTSCALRWWWLVLLHCIMFSTDCHPQ